MKREREPTLKAREPSSPSPATTQRRHRELPWGRLDLHLLEVKVEGVEVTEEVEKCLGPDPVPGAP
jgi:hypothetical protein